MGFDWHAQACSCLDLPSIQSRPSAKLGQDNARKRLLPAEQHIEALYRYTEVRHRVEA
jgi:hypothetical protein